MTNFDRAQIAQIRADLEQALKAVEAKHGINVKVGKISYDDTDFRCKLIASKATKGSADFTVGDLTRSTNAALDAKLREMNLQRRGTGRFANYRLVDYKPSRPKFPFIIEGPQGGRYKLGLQEALRSFKKMA